MLAGTILAMQQPDPMRTPQLQFELLPVGNLALSLTSRVPHRKRGWAWSMQQRLLGWLRGTLMPPSRG